MRSLVISTLMVITCLAWSYNYLSAIDTLQTYSALQKYSGEADSIFIDHPRYYGLFVKDNCSTEDYGTTVLNRSRCWQRVHRNFSPRFWEIGGKSPDRLIGTVKKEIDAINSAAVAAYLKGGDTIEIDSFYTIDRPVFLITNNTYLGTTENAGFMRAEPPVTTLTDTARVGDKIITVKNNTGFRTYQLINITYGKAFDQLAGHISYTASVSTTNTVDSIIQLSGLSIRRTMLPGDTVSLFFPMMEPRFSTLDSIHIKQLTFNGNREHYDFNYDWRINETIILPSGKDIIIEKCRFEDIPNENIILCGATIKACSGQNFNGSAVHFSCNSDTFYTEVLYNNFSNLNEIGDSLMHHSEAGLTFSAKVTNLRVAYNHLESIGEYGIGVFGNDDAFNEITDNFLDAKKGTIALSPFYAFAETNLIYNNKNLNTTDRSTADCWLTQPMVKGNAPCLSNSSESDPMTIGDTITMTIDSIWMRNSNENFVKGIIPIYDDAFFDLVDAGIRTPPISSFHSWNFDQISSMGPGLVFDNGHKNGRYGPGNWGYGPCGDAGKCTNLTVDFVVSRLPDSTKAVGCPLEGLQVFYDGEIESWEYPVYCQKEAVTFNPEQLGSPVLQAAIPSSINNTPGPRTFEVYPNPSRHQLQLQLPSKREGRYQIMNHFGKLVQEGAYTSNMLTIRNLPAGSYFLTVKIENQIFQAFFIKI